ncbi:HTH-type transcriptional regulator HdfR [Alishewanella sp. 16-MA]|uniref:HTH-type transcriptional regulator HdfR n=1 Tax=Alishewanella maricola TaxID=2795740 RepID=A0ABS8C339_9ALTE|nr:HTH-type transcriptional regulator HdfR [Alishewanella maricola]MCB5226757.1 HTH-type transcriptional regulator HdfR [Alishewanella maricola]
MDTELLKTFLEVQHTRHFGKAAENLYLTQSAVSFRIRQLEQQLGVHLFVRHRNNIQLTAAGARLLPHAQTMLSALQRARQDVTQSIQQLQQLSLGATANLWESVLLPVFLPLAAAKPDVTWRTDSLNREASTRQLLEHQLDIAILFDPPKTDEITLVKLTEIHLLPVSSCKEQHAAGKPDERYCYVDWGSNFDVKHQRHFAEQQVVQLKTSSASLAKAWLLQQGGCAYLPAQFVSAELAAGTLKPLEATPSLTLDLYAAYLTDKEYQPQLQAVIRLLQQWQT